MLAHTAAERELLTVKAVLRSLTERFPDHALRILADECKGSQAEARILRQNIIEYLHKDCADFRRSVLASGRTSDAEASLRAMFADLTHPNPTETIMLIDMIIQLPSISGGHATREATSSFVRQITRSLKATTSVTEKLRHIQLLNCLAEKAPAIEPVSALYFFSKHGGAVAWHLLVGQERQAKGLVSRLRVWADKAVEHWQQRAPTTEEETVARRCVEQVLNQLLVSYSGY
jgi:hypothetical protein